MKDPYSGLGVSRTATDDEIKKAYRSLAKKYQLGYEAMDYPENFEKIHDENLRFKALGDKVARLPYKIGDNAITGQFKQKDSALYCPHENNSITINGQLGLLLLLEMTEPYAQLVQSNTVNVSFVSPNVISMFSGCVKGVSFLVNKYVLDIPCGVLCTLTYSYISKLSILPSTTFKSIAFTSNVLFNITPC